MNRASHKLLDMRLLQFYYIIPYWSNTVHLLGLNPQGCRPTITVENKSKA
ncbi:hypothetical protein HanIR_Chr14g0722691 [Helianthus annuus]|nr:hypothetical protein HanIR_Chr14g0722691 [Helianthus annuus]